MHKVRKEADKLLRLKGNYTEEKTNQKGKQNTQKER